MKKECAAVIRHRERGIKGKQIIHQNIEGVVIPTPEISAGYYPQIVQKSDLISNNLNYSKQGAAPSGAVVDVSSFPLSESIALKSSKASQKNHSAMSQTQTSPGTDSNKLKLSQSGLLYTLNKIREPVVEYQEARGVPRNEQITFLTLVTSLCTQAYTAGITILVMLWNLMPLVDGLVYFIRFLLDKTIDIVQTQDNKDRAVKAAILFGELTIISFIIFLIVGLIFMPVYVLIARLFSKIFSMIAW